MIVRSVRDGLREALSRPALVLLLWSWHLALALPAALPAWRWFGLAFNDAPEADRLLSGFSFPLAFELAHDDRVPPWIVLNTTVVSVAALALISNALVAGGTIEVLLSTDSRSLFHRFFRGAGHFFWRYLRLLLLNGVLAIVAAGVLMAATGWVAARVGTAGWERLALAAGATRLLLALVVFGFFVLVLDYARVRVALDDSRGALKASWRSLGFVLRRLPRVVGIALALAAIFLLVIAAFVGARELVPSTTWPLILVMVGVQQLFMIARAALRVARSGAALSFYRATTPLAAPPPAPAATPETARPPAGPDFLESEDPY